MIKRIFAFKLLLLLVFLYSCSTTSNVEILDKEAFIGNFSISDINVINQSGETFDIDIEELLNSALREEIQKRNLFSNGEPAYSLQISIREYKQGSAMMRWIAPIFDEAETYLSIEGFILNKEKKIIAETRVSRSIWGGGGYTIRAWRRVFDQVARELINELVSTI